MQSFFRGLPRFRVKQTYPELDWYRIIQQPYSEAFAPFSNIDTRLFYITLFSLLVVVILSRIFSWILSRPVIEIDPHLERL